MKKTKCYSVRLQSLTQISSKCLKAKAFNGSEALIPISQYFGEDYSVQKSNAYWIAAWLLEKDDVHLQCSFKKEGWYNPRTGNVEPPIQITIEKHTPTKVEITQTTPHDSLTR